MIVVVAAAVAGSKLAQVRAVGGRIVEIAGTFSDAFAHAEQLCEEDGVVHVNSTNPNRIEGQKTAAFEIVEQLGGLPDVLTLPYGGGGNTKAYARGFLEAAGALPRIHPAEAERRADTFASAIRIVEPVHRAEVEDALERSGGSVLTVTEDELDAGVARGRARGGRSSASRRPRPGIAALARGAAKPGERVVCVLTGHGLKDPAAVARLVA